MSGIGILLISHGTPNSLDDIPAFLANIRGGKPAKQAVIDAVRARYEAIGGSSPLLKITQAQAALLSEKTGLPCLIATRMWHPTIEEVLRFVANAGRPHVLIALPAAPHSAHICFEALRKAAQALTEQGARIPVLYETPFWGDHPSFLQGWENATMRILDRIGPGRAGSAAVILTAHSLPLRTAEETKPYCELVSRTADKLIDRLKQHNKMVGLAYQSQGMTDEEWIEPDLPAALEEAHSMRARDVVVVPIGFPADHLETLFDLDIQAKRIAETNGMWMWRAACLNTDELLIDAMKWSVEHVIRHLLQRTTP